MQIGSHWHFGGNEKNTSDVCLTDECITASRVFTIAYQRRNESELFFP